MPRTDNDSWDLASSVGATATAVAASRAMASRGPTPFSTIRSPTRWSAPSGWSIFVKMVDGEIARSTTTRC